MRFSTCQFPPAWKTLAGVRFRSYNNHIVWNRNHNVARLVSEEDWDWASANQSQVSAPLEARTAILGDKRRAAAWILRMLSLDAAVIWCGLIERDPAFLRAVWSVVFQTAKRSAAVQPTAIRTEDRFSSEYDAVTCEQWEWYKYSDGIEPMQARLPDPGPDWTLTFDNDGETPIQPPSPNVRRDRKRRPRRERLAQKRRQKKSVN